MLASFQVYLKPHTNARIGTHAGRALHGLFMHLVGQASPELADQLHSPMPAKPFTVSTLLGRFDRDGREKLAVPDRVYRVRYTVLSDEVFAALSRVLLDKYLYGQTVDIDNQPFEIERVGIKPDDTRGWGQVTSYQELYDGAGDAREITLRFYSPTAFKTGDINLLFPLARSVFGSYLRFWDAFAGYPLSDDLLDFVEAQVVASRYELETRVLHTGKYPLIGFAGTCTYRVMDDDPVKVHQVNALADFALFAGTGMKTTQGMGQTRRIG